MPGPSDPTTNLMAAPIDQLDQPAASLIGYLNPPKKLVVGWTPRLRLDEEFFSIPKDPEYSWVQGWRRNDCENPEHSGLSEDLS